MIVMTHSVYSETDEAPGTGLFVHAVAFPCEHVWNIQVPTEERLKPKGNTPKAWHRYAENVLLSTGKVRFAKTETETKAGVKDNEQRRLVCKECG